jgi:hypothetical protein
MKDEPARLQPITFREILQQRRDESPPLKESFKARMKVSQNGFLQESHCVKYEWKDEERM